MQTNHLQRILLIAIFVLVALFALWPKPWQTLEPNLKPGIDMVGGSSLTYRLNLPPGRAPTEELTQTVVASLKRRVDPDGVKNLIWRPTGSGEIEIQMPLTGDAARAQPLRQAYNEALNAVEDRNIRLDAARSAVKQLEGEALVNRLDDLAAGHDRRRELLSELAEQQRKLNAAQEAQDAIAAADALDAIEAIEQQLQETNISLDRLQALLQMENEQQRDAAWQAIVEADANYPERQEALQELKQAWTAFAPVKDQLQDSAGLKQLLKGSGVLEFHILATESGPRGEPRLSSDLSTSEYLAMEQRLREHGPRPQAGDTLRWYRADRPEEFRLAGGGTQFGAAEYAGEVYVLTKIDPGSSMVKGAGAAAWDLEQASRQPDGEGGMAVSFRFNTVGAQLFRTLTGNHLPTGDGFRSHLAIVLDDRIISAPTLNTEIGREGIIQGGRGGFSTAELDYLVNTLNAGALPARLSEEPIAERTVGPQLGRENLRRGLLSCIAGVLITAFFLIAYYYVLGVVATFAVLLNLLFILAAMAAYNATFTLPGVAGVILGIGMAVDANVLIFERLREEQKRGLSIRMAVRNAYDRAFSAILDSNVTTGITAAILYWVGSEEVKGFGLTLMLGIISSMFTSLYVTRTVYGVLIDWFGMEKFNSLPLTFPKWDKLLTPAFDWMAKVRALSIASVLFIIVGMALFGWRFAGGHVMDVEFTSGTAVQFELKEATPIREVRELLNAQSDVNEAFPDPQVVAVESAAAETVYEVVTPTDNAVDVRNAVVKALAGRLNVVEPSTFVGMDQRYEAAQGTLVVPVTDETVSIGDLSLENAQEYQGGVAIALRQLQPAVEADALRSRIEQQAAADGPTPPGRRTTVETFNDGHDAVVYIYDPSYRYDASNPLVQEQWTRELAGPAWENVVEAVSRPAELQKVNTFNPSVARQTQIAALVAMTLSIIVIMAYIWLRFGSMRYATATVVALAHDVCFVLAAIGFAHLLAETFLGNWLLLEPFRINLNMVAALLTVVGFSMNDTVVVFDRIRENRGHYGHVNRTVINDSINQTLSRTLLTGGTTLLAVLVMYTLGGPGVHGFTFALVVGFAAGTYSSIAIASPLLLYGAKQGQVDKVRSHIPAAGAA